VKSPVSKRSIVIAGHKTSVSLEDEFWNSLKEIAGERGMTLAELVAAIDGNRPSARDLNLAPSLLMVKKSDATGGDADIAAAKAIEANIVGDFARYGVQQRRALDPLRVTVT
jgi:predicted DNA-binding ribbon-helix-helix protein